MELLDCIPDYKMGYVLAYVQGVAADEEADDIFCQRMLENYENTRILKRIKFSPLMNVKKSGVGVMYQIVIKKKAKKFILSIMGNLRSLL